MLLTPSDFKKAKNKIKAIETKHQEAFEVLIKHGYSIVLAFETYLKLYKYVTYNPNSGYAATVKIILAVNNGFDAGVKLSKAIRGIHDELCSLSLLETRLLKEITVSTPYEFKEVHALYTKTKSFDKTIYLVEKAQQLSTPLLLLAEISEN